MAESSLNQILGPTSKRPERTDGPNRPTETVLFGPKNSESECGPLGGIWTRALPLQPGKKRMVVSTMPDGTEHISSLHNYEVLRNSLYNHSLSARERDPERTWTKIYEADELPEWLKERETRESQERDEQNKKDEGDEDKDEDEEEEEGWEEGVVHWWMKPGKYSDAPLSAHPPIIAEMIRERQREREQREQMKQNEAEQREQEQMQRSETKQREQE